MLDIFIRLLFEAQRQTCSSNNNLERLAFTRLDLCNDMLKLPPLPRINNLKYLSICECTLQVSEICNVLQYSHSLEFLYLSKNGLDDMSAVHIGAFLQEGNIQLKDLYLHYNRITDVGALALLHGNNKTLRTLNLECNDIGLDSLEFAPLLATSKLRILTLGANPITTRGMQVLGLALETNTQMKCLYLSEIAMGNCGLQAFALGLARNQCLEQLSLAECRIDDFGALAIAGVFKTNASLTGIDLSANLIGISGARNIASAIKQSLVCNMREIVLDCDEAHELVCSTIRTTNIARKMFALRCAMETKRLGTKSAMKRLPRELCRMVASCLHDFGSTCNIIHEDEEEEL